MAHVNSHKEPRRAKMLDLANKTVKGSVGSRNARLNRRGKKRRYHQWERRVGDQTYRHLRGFRCSGDAECDCPGCSCEPHPATRVPPGGPGPWEFEEVAPPLDDLGGAMRSAKKWARRLGSSDAFLSWLKQNYPDTLAGRHAIDHIMDSIPRRLGCVCKIDWSEHGAKGNHAQCTCGAFLVKYRTKETLRWESKQI